jgi:hypothetical protein
VVGPVRYPPPKAPLQLWEPNVPGNLVHQEAERGCRRLACALSHSPPRATVCVCAQESEGLDAGYTNDSNPFGDTNLTERFVWHKKLEKQITEGVDLKELGVKAEKGRQEQRLVRFPRRTSQSNHFVRGEGRMTSVE